MEGVVLSQQTADRIKRILGTSPGSSGGNAPGNTGHAHVKFVHITGTEETGSAGTGRWPCVPTELLNDGTWRDYDGEHFAIPANGSLNSGSRYIAIQTGDDDDGNPQWSVSSLSSGECEWSFTAVTGVSVSAGSMSSSGCTLSVQLTVNVTSTTFTYDPETCELETTSTSTSSGGGGTVSMTLPTTTITYVSAVACVNGALTVTTDTAKVLTC